MWKIEPPKIGALHTFRECIKTISNQQLKSDFEKIEYLIENETGKFSALGVLPEWHYMLPHAWSQNGINNKEMTWLYENRLRKSSGRPIYDSLLAGAIQGVCPLCGDRDVSTLDHYLAKQRFGALAVSPINLVPACSVCNSSSKAPFPTNSDDQLIHPYFDNIGDEKWLDAKLVHSPKLTRDLPQCTFFVSPPPQWSQKRNLTNRLLNHFREFGLSRHYAVKAAQKLTRMRQCFSQHFWDNGANAVKHELQRLFASHRAACINFWETALYENCANDDWFCSGGFGLLPSSDCNLPQTARIETANLKQDNEITVTVTSELLSNRGTGLYAVKPSDENYDSFVHRYQLRHVGETATVKMEWIDNKWRDVQLAKTSSGRV